MATANHTADTHSSALVLDPGHAHGHDGGHGEYDVHAHIAPVKFYVGIFGALIFLTFVTVGVSYFDFGSANTVIAMIVATMKASLVAAFFMHLTHDKLFNTVCLLAAFMFLGIFFLFTYEDTSTRARVDEANGTEVLPGNGEAAPGGMPMVVVKKSGNKGEGGSGTPTSPSEKASEGHGAPKAAGSAVGGGGAGGGGTPSH